MAVSLTKGQTISLEKTSGGGLTDVVMGLGWDAYKRKGIMGMLFGSNKTIDLDASCALFDEKKQLVDTVYFKQLKSKDGSIVHTGDNLTGDGEGDDEQIIVQLLRVPAQVKYLVFTVNSYQGQTFNDVENAYCRLVDKSTDTEIARYTLSEKGAHTGMIMAKVYREGNAWKMSALGVTTTGRTINDLLPAMSAIL